MLSVLKCKAIKARLTIKYYHDMNGLYLCVHPSNKKSWVYMNKKRGHSYKKTLGSFNNISLAEARAMIPKVKHRAKAVLELEYNDSFNNALLSFFSFVYDDFKNPTGKKLYDSIIIHLTPLLDKPLASVDTAMIISIFDTMNKKGIYQTGKRVLSTLKRFYRWSLTRRMVLVDPVYMIDISSVLTKKETKHIPSIIEPDRIREMLTFFLESKSIKPIYKYMFLLSIYTACRNSTIRNAKWEHMDLEKGVWTIPASEMKMKKEFKVYFHRHLISHLKDLKSLKLSDTYLFPSFFKNKGVITAKPFAEQFKNIGFHSDEFTPHGFRSMFSTLCNELTKWHGLSSEITELCLAHEDENTIRKIYNRSLREEEKRDLWIFWGQWLYKLYPKLSDSFFKQVSLF